MSFQQSRLQSVFFHALPGFFLLILALLLFGFLKTNDVTVDEPVHLLGGLEILQNGGHTVNPESGVFPQLWSALPLCGRISMPPSGTLETAYSGNPYAYARDVLLCTGSGMQEKTGKELSPDGEKKEFPGKRTPGGVFELPRIMMSLLCLLCGYVIYLAGTMIAGRKAALAALGLYVFTPLYISNGPLVTADMAVSLFFLLSLYSFQRLLQRITLWNLGMTSLSLCLLFLSKMSAPVIAPVLLLMVILKGCSSSPLEIRLPFSGKRKITDRKWKGACLLLLCLSLTVLLFGAIWTAYGYRAEFPELPPGVPAARSFEQAMEATKDMAVPEAAKLLFLDKLLPQPFFYGFLHACFHARERWSFLDGKVSEQGHALFFPLVFFYKTPPPLLIAFLLSLAALGMSLKSRFGRKKAFLALPYLLFTVVFLIPVLSSHLNIGYRHLMPAITVFFPLTALGAEFLFRAGRKKKEGGKDTGLLRYLPLAICVWNAVECMTVYPHSLAYFSSLAGGPERAYRHVVDSSLDWGQDLKNIAETLEKEKLRFTFTPEESLANPPVSGNSADAWNSSVAENSSESGESSSGAKIFLCYFGSIPPSSAGLENLRLLPPSSNGGTGGEKEALEEILYEMEPGIYLFSATHLHGFGAHPRTDCLLEHPALLGELRGIFYQALRAKNGKGEMPDLGSDLRLLTACSEYQSLRAELLRRILENSPPDFHVNYSILGWYLDQNKLKMILKDLIP